MPHITVEHLTQFVTDLFAAEGVPEPDAHVVAANLVGANLTAHDSHGVRSVRRYVAAIRDGLVNLQPTMRFRSDRPASVALDVDWGFGAVGMEMLLASLFDKAATQGVATGTLHHCNDLGCIGNFTARAAERGFVALMTVNDGGANPSVAPFGGKRVLLSTNPLSAAFPVAGQWPICIDMATSTCAGERAIMAAAQNQSLPPEFMVDGHGRPSTDPKDLFGNPAGALLPFGGPHAGHKGFALSLIVDLLSGALSGAGCSGHDGRDAQGAFFMCLNIEAFTSAEAFDREVKEFITKIQSTPRANGVEEIFIPGQMEARAKQDNMTHGLAIPQPVWQELTDLAESLEVPVPTLITS